MYNLYLIENGVKKYIGFFDDLNDAKDCIYKMFVYQIVTEDSDNPNHLDVFAYEGQMSDTFAIEPAI